MILENTLWEAPDIVLIYLFLLLLIGTPSTFNEDNQSIAGTRHVTQRPTDAGLDPRRGTLSFIVQPSLAHGCHFAT